MAKIALPFEIPREWSATTAQAIEDNFRKLFGSSARLGPPAAASGAALVNGLDLIVPSAGDMIACVVGGIFIALPIAATNQRVLTNNGGTPTWALVDLAAGVTGLLPYANFVNATATQRLLGRNTAGSGIWQEVTLTQLLDWVGSPAQGDLLYRNATGWARLGAGTSGFFLKTQGAGADPLWAAVVVVPATITFTNTQRALGRNTAGGGAGEEVTLTQILDWVGSPAQGDIFYRNATGWVRLAAGTAGQLLQSGGASANPSWVTPGATSGVVDFINQNYIFASGRLTASPIPWGHVGPSAIVAPSAASDAQGTWQQYSQTGTTINLRGGFDAGQRSLFRADNDPTLEFVIKTGATMTGIRIYALMSDTATNGGVDDLGGTSKYMGFRYSTVAADGGWVGVCRDGTTQSVTGTVAPIAASTLYKLKIRKSGSTVFFSVNGGAEVSQTNNLPAAATEFGIDLMSSNAAAGSTHPILFSRYRCYYGS